MFYNWYLLFWVYAVMAVVIIVLVVKYLSLSDEFNIQKDLKDTYFQKYLEYKEKYQDDEKILDNIKDSLPFN